MNDTSAVDKSELARPESFVKSMLAISVGEAVPPVPSTLKPLMSVLCAIDLESLVTTALRTVLNPPSSKASEFTYVPAPCLAMLSVTASGPKS